MSAPVSKRLAEVAGGQEGLVDLAVAAVEGVAVGGCFQLALGCDLRIATADARFSMREPALGILPDVTGSKNLVATVGYARALEWTASARWVGATEALSAGLVSGVCEDPASLDSALAELVETLTAHPIGAVRGVKRLYLDAADTAYEDQAARERAAQFDRFAELRSS